MDILDRVWRRALAFACVLFVGAFVLCALPDAHASHDQNGRIVATVRCAHPAEDSLAHLRMRAYDVLPDGRIVVDYVCRRNGY